MESLLGAARLARLAGVAGAVFALQLLVPTAAAAAPDPASVSRVTVAGEFCPIGGCRSTPAPWSGAAFGATVLAIAWTARRRDSER